MSTRLPFLPAVLAGLIAAGPVLAQTPSAPSTATPAPAAPGAATAATSKRDAMTERRITALHTKLKITSQQEPQFDAFAEAMRQNATALDQFQAEHASLTTSGSAVDLLSAYAAFTQAHAQQVQTLVGPFTTLYGALSPEQKRTADQSFRDFARSQQQRDARMPKAS